MICKTANIKHSYNALAYAERGGELLHGNNVYGTAKEINKDFKYFQDLNTRAEKKTIHAIISFNPGDRHLNDQELIDISQAYAKKQGFTDNQYAVYLHEDKQHRHLHIIANRIGIDLKAVKDSNNFYRNKEFATEMEKAYNLIPTKGRTLGNKNNYERDNARLNSLKQVVDACKAQAKTIEELSENLKEYGIKTYLGRGISFTDKSGASFKGSALGREYSLANLTKSLNEPIKEQDRSLVIEEAINEQYKNSLKPTENKESTHTNTTKETSQTPFVNFPNFNVMGGDPAEELDKEAEFLYKKRKKKGRGMGM